MEKLLPLFEAIYDLGDQIYAAIEVDDAEAFAALTEERGKLIERFAEIKSSVPSDFRDLAEMARRFKLQEKKLSKAVADSTRRQSEQMGQLSQVKGAQQQYRPLQAQKSFLNPNLRG